LTRALVPTPATIAPPAASSPRATTRTSTSCRQIAATRGRAIAALERKYRDETGVAALKIRHNGVLGYFIEVPAKHADRLMAADSRLLACQTMAGACASMRSPCTRRRAASPKPAAAPSPPRKPTSRN